MHVCEFSLDELIVRDRMGELGAGVGIGEGDVEGGLHETSI